MKVLSYLPDPSLSPPLEGLATICADGDPLPYGLKLDCADCLQGERQ